MGVTFRLSPWLRQQLTPDDLAALTALAPADATITAVRRGGPRGEITATVTTRGAERGFQRGFNPVAVIRRALVEANGAIEGPHPLDRFLVHEPIGRLSQDEREPTE